MDKKLIIKIVVIVVSFGSSGLILYYGMFKGSTAPSSPFENNPLQMVSQVPGGISSGSTINASSITGQDVLPKGESLSFDKAVDPLRFNYNIAPYPKVNPSTEIGIPVTNLIVPDAFK